MRSSRSITVTFEPYGIKSQFKKGIQLLDALKSADLNIRSDCGGKGICGKCKVAVRNRAKINSIAETEKEHLSRFELKSGYRLACCCHLVHDATVLIPEETRVTARKFLTEATKKRATVDPVVRKFYVKIGKPSLSDVRSDSQRLIDSMRDTYGLEVAGVDYQLLKRLPEILREAEWKATVTIYDNDEIISVERGHTTDEAYGIAIDIGTSKILGYLSNLVTGDLISIGYSENPQAIHGEDVISRIAFASEGENSLQEMQKLTVQGVNSVVTQACKTSECTPDHVYETTLVGNTVMHHLFLGIQPRFLGTSPYVPVVNGSINVKARELQISVNPGANIHMLPLIAGFVGADAVADIIATEIYESSKLSLVIDIGTNTEIILGDKHGMIACSCASGPAFEGAHIKCGMKAMTGAIERLQIRPRKHYEVEYETVGKAKPIGICGSGMIDAVANLLKARLINESGIFAENSSTPRLRVRNAEKEFVLVFKKEGAGRDIVITQRDVEQIQLAKAAIYAGCRILMKRRKAATEDLKNVFVAGAFGNYIDLENAKLIGMFPDVPTKNIRFVGNAAGAGARMALLSKKHRRIASSISKKTSYLELALDSDFQTEFTSALFLPNKDRSRFRSFKTG